MKPSQQVKSIVLCAIFAALIAIGGFIKIPMPYVPFTLQVLFVTLTGLLLGAKRGMYAVLVYIILGLIGFPVFSNGGGIGYIFHPTFGYIIGFLVSITATGALTKNRKSNSYLSYLLPSLLGLLIIYLIGTVYFYFITNFYLGNPKSVGFVLIYCFLVFLPGDTLSCLIASLIAKKMSPAIKELT